MPSKITSLLHWLLEHSVIVFGSILLIPLFSLCCCIPQLWEFVKWDVKTFSLLGIITVLLLLICSPKNLRFPKKVFWLELLAIWLVYSTILFCTIFSPKINAGGADGARYTANAMHFTQYPAQKVFESVWFKRGVFLYYLPAKLAGFHQPKNLFQAYKFYLITWQLGAILITAAATYFFIRLGTKKEGLARACAFLYVISPIHYIWLLSCQSDIIGIMWLSMGFCLFALGLKFLLLFPRLMARKKFVKPKKKTLLYLGGLMVLLSLINLCANMAELTRSIGIFFIFTIFAYGFYLIVHQLLGKRWLNAIKIAAFILCIVIAFFGSKYGIGKILYSNENTTLKKQTTWSWFHFYYKPKVSGLDEYYFAKIYDGIIPAKETRRYVVNCALAAPAMPRWFSADWGIRNNFFRILAQNRIIPVADYLKYCPSYLNNSSPFFLALIALPVLAGLVFILTKFSVRNPIFLILFLFAILTIYTMFSEAYTYHAVLWNWLLTTLAAIGFCAPHFGKLRNCRPYAGHLLIPVFIVIFGLLSLVAQSFHHDYRLQYDVKKIPANYQVKTNYQGVLAFTVNDKKFEYEITHVDKEKHNTFFIISHFSYDKPIVDKKFSNNKFTLQILEQSGNVLYEYDSEKIFYQYGRYNILPPLYVKVKSDANGEIKLKLIITRKDDEKMPLNMEIAPFEFVPEDDSILKFVTKYL